MCRPCVLLRIRVIFDKVLKMRLQLFPPPSLAPSLMRKCLSPNLFSYSVTGHDVFYLFLNGTRRERHPPNLHTLLCVCVCVYIFHASICIVYFIMQIVLH